jgi:uncharacterized cupredoxin-like copper-binding protein
MFRLRMFPITLFIAALAGTSSAAPGHDHAAHPGGEQKAWGVAGDAKSVQRTVAVTMGDNMRFTPERVEVRQGETVKFVIRNSGQAAHEFVLGTKEELDAHAAMMAASPNMAHDEASASVSPGKSREFIWTFNRAGDFDFGCLIPGHYQAGMVGTVKVTGGQR